MVVVVVVVVVVVARVEVVVGASTVHSFILQQQMRCPPKVAEQEVIPEGTGMTHAPDWMDGG